MDVTEAQRGWSFGDGPPVGEWRCPVCAADIVHDVRAGRKRVYCTNACRQRAYRWRRDHGVRILATPWLPATRSESGRAHAVRPATDYVGVRHDQHGRNVSVCGAFARTTKPRPGWHNEFLPGTRRACASCTRLIGADPSWADEYPVVGYDELGYYGRYRPPDERYASYLASFVRPHGEHAEALATGESPGREPLRHQPLLE